MFVRDAEFKCSNMAAGIVPTGDTRSFSATTRYDNGFREANLNFYARLYTDGIWRVKIIADRLPSVAFTGVGDPIVEFIDFHRMFLTHFAGDRKELPWEQLN